MNIRRCVLAPAVLLVLLLTAAPAAAFPTVTPEGGDLQYQGFGRVFPDPHGGCQPPGTPTCSTERQGNVPATQFIQFQELLDGLEYMNTREEWQPFIEVIPLDGRLGFNNPADGDEEVDTSDYAESFPGNGVGGDHTPQGFEHVPDASYRSAGLPTPDLQRSRADLMAVRVTDERVPDAGKKRYAISLSLHGIERAGVEGGTRAMEDLVTAVTTQIGEQSRLDTPIVSENVDADAPTFGEILRDTVIYFTYMNPDGWRRGSISEGGLLFQRYNGNGVDPNRDWLSIGYNFPGYSAFSEPETRGFRDFYTQIRSRRMDNGSFTAGLDLHGQPGADSLSYSLFSAGQHDYRKNLRQQQTGIAINIAQFEATQWSPLIQPDDAPRGECVPAPIYSYCDRIYSQKWGTVYDTINYTTTGSVGDWFDSSLGPDADGLTNEMSFSHLDKQTSFERETEQLHVDGNRAIIYAQLTRTLLPPEARYDAPGRKGYVPNARVARAASDLTQAPPPNTRAQDPIDETATPDLAEGGTVIVPFEVQRTEPEGDTPGIFNGGMRIQATTSNVQGVGTGSTTLTIECKNCDKHPGVIADDEWVEVTQDYNQSPVYAQSGVTATVNAPQAIGTDGKPVEWRAVLTTSPLGIVVGPAPVTRVRVNFTQGRASESPENAEGSTALRNEAYDVSNTDYFSDLNRYIDDEDERFREISPRRVIDGQQSLDGLDSLVLADEALPGYTGTFGTPREFGPPTADIPLESEDTTSAAYTSDQGQNRVPGSFTRQDFTIGENDGNRSLTVRIDWEDSTNDFDLYLYRDGVEVDRSAAGGTDFEEFTLESPEPGDYSLFIDNYAAIDPAWTGAITFAARPAASGGGDTGAFSEGDKDRWMAALNAFVERGGNLVLTDGALQALPDLTSLAPEAVFRKPVYAGQVAFGTSADDDGSTLEDPLATTPESVSLLGARFNTDRRRQTFEPGAIGYFIDETIGPASAAGTRQFDIDREAFEALPGARIAGTSATSAGTEASGDFTRVAYGEIERGEGQIRFIGGLLPQPNNQLNHPGGLEAYAVTYTGYILMRNVLEVTPRGGTAPPPGGPPATPPPGAPATPRPGGSGTGSGGGSQSTPASCASTAGFRSTGVRRSGSGLRIAFSRRLRRPVNVDVFQTSVGSRVVSERLVARFNNRTRSFTWNGRANRRGRTVRDGTLFVRLRMATSGGASDVRRHTLLRRDGRLSSRPSHHRREDCGLLRSFKLTRPAFGGRGQRAQGVSFRVTSGARVTVDVLRGSRRVRRLTSSARRAGVTHRLRLPAQNLPRGDYRIRITVVSGSRRVVATLVSRRL